MLINFRPGKIWHSGMTILAKVMSKISVKTDGFNSQLSLVVQATMVRAIRESVVNRYVRRATADMYRNNRQDIRCPCRKCKLQALFTPSSETIRDHLLMRGFMDGHTQWMSSGDDEDDDDEEFGGNDEEEGHQQ